MTRVTTACALGLCLSLTMACGRDRDESGAIAEKNPTVLGDKDGRPTTVSQTGCVTASGDQFVLTDLERSGAAQTATTESYQLVGRDPEELRKFVGKQVRVTGAADAPKAAEVREVTPPAPAATSGSGEPAATPKVATMQETRLEVTQLHIESIAEIGGTCTAPKQ
jgi:hypothetical protein